MELLSRWTADLILLVGHQARTFWENLTILSFSWQQVVLDILLVAVLLYFLLVLIKGSRAVNIIMGLVVIALIYWLSRAMQLVTLGWLLDKFLTVVLVAIPVIFQQELRMALERIGHTNLFVKQKERQMDRMISRIVEACGIMAQAKTGALVVIQDSVPLKEYIDTGISLDSEVTKELLLSIFNHDSPLHDGAVIIRNGRVAAAACLLPHSSVTDGPLMGTRHKAGLGLSEATDAAIVVVSEERGTISFARKGEMVKNISVDRLREFLTEAFHPVSLRKSHHRHQSKNHR
jgi:diadenylate cyclase